MTTQLTPAPIFKAWSNLGLPLVGGKLFTYVAGTTTKQASYTDSSGSTPNTNPVILNFRGEANVWLDPTKVYKLVLSPSTDTDPPTNPLWTVDNISGGIASPSFNIIPSIDNTFTLGSPTVSWANVYVGANHAPIFDPASGNVAYYARTAAEIAAALVPNNFSYPQRTPGRFPASTQLSNAAQLFALFGDPRTKPSGFSFVPGNIISCAGPGQAVHDFNAEQNFLAIYSAQTGASEYFVDFNNGNDLNVGSFSSPFKTIRGCFQNAAGLGICWLLPGVYATPFDARGIDNTIAGGTLARAVRIKAWAGPGTVIFRDPGAQPGAMTWVLTPTTTFEYEATPPGSESVYHIIFHDDQGEIQIQWYASAALVNAQTAGWYQDPATKKIYIRYQNRDLTLAGNAARFEIIYGSASGSIVYGAKVYLEGITFRGGNELDITFGNGFQPVCFARYCTWQYRGYHNVQVGGGITLFQDCASELSLGGDGFNYTNDLPTATAPQAVEVDCIGRNNGIRQYSATDGVRNKQGSTGHDSALICRVNGQYYGNYGQNIADTGVNSATWMVGTVCGAPYADLAPGGIGGYFNLWTEGTAWLDNVSAGTKAATYGLWIESGTANLYNCNFYGTTAVIGKNVGVTGLYDPAI